MKFSCGGVPLSARKRDTLAGLERVFELGLGGMELEWVRGVNMKAEMAEKVRARAAELGLILTAHAPYYINLNSREPEKITASVERIRQTVATGALVGAQKITFHPAFNHDDSPEMVYERVRAACADLVAACADLPVKICPETTGKESQFGSLDELLQLAQDVPGLGICIDFAHLCARSVGKVNGYEATVEVLNKVEKALGASALREIYAHLSGIAWSDKGERHHLRVADPENLFDVRGCLRALHERKCDGVIICESPAPEDDALVMKEMWESQSW